MEIETTKVSEVYEKIAPFFDKTRGYTWKWIGDYVNSLPKNSLICDLGCGNGRNMRIQDYQFIGADNCKSFVSMCNRNGLNALEGDMCNIPLENNSVDSVIAVASFHHLSSEVRRIKALMEIKRILKPGKTAMISVWSINQPKKTRRTFSKYGGQIVQWNQNGDIYDRYYYIFKIEEIKQLFAICGLNIYDHKWDCGNEVFYLKNA